MKTAKANPKYRLNVEFVSRENGLLIKTTLAEKQKDCYMATQEASQLLPYYLPAAHGTKNGQPIEKTAKQLAAEANLFCYDFLAKNGHTLETVQLNRVFAIE